MLPQAEQARKAIWEAINPHTGKRRIDEAFPKELREATRTQEMFIRFKSGSTWQVVGSDNFNSLVGSPPIGIVASEFALADPAAWDYLRPILMENGGWFAAITTPRGHNHAKSMLDMAKKSDGWFAEVLSARDTGLFTTQQLDEELAEMIASRGENDGRAMFEQEYECSFDAAIVGAYFSAEIGKANADKRITRVSVDPVVKVDMAWDLGIDDATSIWFTQDVGSEVHVIDHLEVSGEGLPQIVKRLEAKDYRYGRCILPHDAEARELGTGKSRVETLQALGVRNIEIVPAQDVADGINAVRLFLAKCWFDAERCARGIEALKQYRREWDSKRQVWRERPLHDWTSHAADAMRYRALARAPLKASAKALVIPNFGAV